MVSPVSNKKMKCILGFGPDSASLYVKHFVQMPKIVARNNFFLPARNSLLSKKQEALNFQSVLVAVTPQQENASEMVKEVLLLMKRRRLTAAVLSYQTYMEKKLPWKLSLLEVDAVFRPEKGILF